jgi:hypothetical protein
MTERSRAGTQFQGAGEIELILPACVSSVLPVLKDRFFPPILSLARAGGQRPTLQLIPGGTASPPGIFV